MPLSTALLVALVVLIDFIIVGAIMWAVTESWNDLGRAFPSRSPGPDAVRRNFQSFKFGVFNLGWSIHIAVDEMHLHMVPVRLLRMFRAQSASVPWSEVRLLKRGKRWATARIGKHTLKGPAWALGLSEAESAAPGPATMPISRK